MEKENVILQFSGQNLADKDIMGKGDPYLGIDRSLYQVDCHHYSISFIIIIIIIIIILSVLIFQSCIVPRAANTSSS